MNARGVLGRLLLVGFSLLLALGAAELALRVADIDYTPMRVEDEVDDRPQNLFDNASFIYDPVLFWRPRPGGQVFNRQGFRGALVTDDRPAGALLVAAVGDSNTLGWQGATGEHWPGELERLLRADDDRHRVINAGVWGYSSHQGVSRLREVLAFSPDLVTISFGSNDAHPVMVPDHAFAGVSPRPTAWRRQIGRFRLGRLLFGALTAAAVGDAAGDEPTQRVELERYRANLRRMIALSREANAVPVLLTRPYLDSVPEPPRWKGPAPLYNAATMEVGAAEGVIVVDFYSLFKGREELFADESHFTADGHRLAAEILLRRLRPRLATAPVR